jgi:multiple sugar transport system permease protein
MQMIGAYQAFTSAFVVSGGSGGRPTPRSSTPSTSTRRGSPTSRWGYASAMAWVLLAIIALSSAVAFSLGRHWVHYSDV